MILPVNVQEVIVAYLKANTSVTALVPAVEIRERQWVGDKFAYPNIRVYVGLIERLVSGCNRFSANAEITVFSEKDSSKEADTIAGVVAQQLDRHAFIRNGINFSRIEVMNITTAVNEGGIWLAKLGVSIRIAS